MIIKLLVEGGEMKPGPALSQKLGPLGINMGKIISEVNKATSDFSGIKVPVSLDINTKTKDFTVKVSTPPTSELLKKELGLKKASSQPDKLKVANVPIELVIKIAQIKQNDMLVNDFKAAVKSVLGSCNSLGILVESKSPKEVIEEINKGNYAEEIKREKTEANEEKLDALKKEFAIIEKKQEAIVKEIEEKKKAKEAAMAPAVATTTTATTSAPAETKEKK